MTRGDCENGPRPCLRVACRHHLLLELGRRGGLSLRPTEGEGKHTLQQREVYGEDEFLERAADLLLVMPETCALDVADQGGATLEAVGGLLGIAKERVRQVELDALAKVRAATQDEAEGAGAGAIG